MKRYRYLAVLLVVAVFGFERYFLTPKTEEMKESIELRYNSLRKDEQSLRNAGVTDSEINLIAHDLKKIEERLIQEKSEFLASARLQGEVSGMTEKAGLKVLTIRPLSAVKIGNYSAIPVYFEGNGTIKQMGEFLRLIESGKHLIKVEKLNINITNLQNPRELKFKIQVAGVGRL